MAGLPMTGPLGTGRSKGGKRWVKTAVFRATNLFVSALGRSKSRRSAGFVPVFYCYCPGCCKKVYFVELPLDMSSNRSNVEQLAAEKGEDEATDL